MMQAVDKLHSGFSIQQVQLPARLHMHGCHANHHVWLPHQELLRNLPSMLMQSPAGDEAAGN
jgi:hypothetical protein